MRAFALVALLAACGGKSPPPAAPAPATPAASTPAADPARMSDEEFEGMMRDTVALFEAMGNAADASGGDCDKLAAGLDQALADHHAVVERARALKGNADIDKRADAWLSSHDEAVAPVQKVAQAGQHCGDNAAFQAVMKKFDTM
ncbi:MAG: hypothetical protein K8W52_05065 [Deltaproteobacteria bacterium]|nr:hypothetical protein [Deltaproteobacteria bacterium]